MSELANPVIPPAAKIAPVESPPPEPQKPVEPESGKPAESNNEPGKAPAKGKGHFVRETSDRLETAIRDAEKAAGEPSEHPVEPPEGKREGLSSEEIALNKEIETETRGMEAKQRAAWTKLRYENRDFARKVKDHETTVAKIADLEAQLAEARKAPPSLAGSEEIEGLKSRLAEAEKILAVKDIEATQEYQSAVSKPRSAIEDMARGMAAKYNLNEADVMRALHDRGDKRSDLLTEVAAGMNEVDRYDFYAGARQLRELDGKADVLRANAKETLNKINEQRQSQVTQVSQEILRAREMDHKNGWAELQKAVPILTPAEGDDDITKAWNNEIVNAEKFAREADYNKFDVKSQVAILHRAAVYPLLVGAISSFQSELKSMSAELQKLRGSRPAAGPGAASNEHPERKKKGGFLEAVNDKFAELGI